ncbi:MAG: ribbon-helix-helix domain-containing protein [Candidatus Jordarchaeaceae archaeon]
MDSFVLPSVRISKKLWKYLQRIMEEKMFTSTTELIRDALRKYVQNHMKELNKIDFEIIDATLILEEGRKTEKRREERLLKLAEELRTGH